MDAGIRRTCSQGEKWAGNLALSTRSARGGSRGTRNGSSIKYWALAPEELADAVVYAIDQPSGINISDVMVRASGDDFVI